jgi:hypothetical protein
MANNLFGGIVMVWRLAVNMGSDNNWRYGGMAALNMAAWRQPICMAEGENKRRC